MTRQERKAYRAAYYIAHRDEEVAAAKEYQATHREEVRAYNRAYKAQHRSEIAEYNAAYQENNREKIKALRLENREKIAAHEAAHRGERKARMKKYFSNTPGARVAANMRSRVWSALKNNSKSARTFELVGCTSIELCRHLEKQFRPGMTWENYGPVWHVDHIKTCVSFDLTQPEQQKICFHWTNLQPLFAEENMRKDKKCRI